MFTDTGLEHDTDMKLYLSQWLVIEYQNKFEEDDKLTTAQNIRLNWCLLFK